jgi:transcriptional regulator with PAS, ATPase and Fis domain
LSYYSVESALTVREQLSTTLLWLSQNAHWYRRLEDALSSGTAASTASRFLRLLKTNRWDCAVLQLPIDGRDMAEIAQTWIGLADQPRVLVFDPAQTLRPGEFPKEWPAAWHLLRSAEESAVRDGIAQLANRSETAPANTWRNMLVGESNAMSEVRELIGLVAKLNSTILISGDTGTGKEVAARAIHAASNRAGKPFVALNCAALPESLLEAELFGHTRGAFTGAATARVGLFEQAEGGTIFLDEIGEMPLELQAKLLRVLQERQILRLGSSEVTPIDVRIITATNADLRTLCAVKRFRSDLFFRLNVVPVQMPPLRDRPEDILPLLEHFLAKIAKDENLPRKRVEERAKEQLLAYSWPGNVRELEHTVERAVAISGNRTILQFRDFGLEENRMFESLPLEAEIDIPDSGFDFDQAIRHFQIAMIERAMQKAGGNRQRAANLLGMKRTTMISKCKALELTC